MPASLEQASRWLTDHRPDASQRSAGAHAAPNRQRLSLVRRSTASCLLLPLFWLGIAGGIGIALADPANMARDECHSPAPGTAERRAILDVLRAEVHRWHQIDVVFVVDEIRVIRDWAWVHTRPQSADGLNRYEDIVALLHRQPDQWRVVELDANTATALQQRFPDLPAALLESR
ncbi:MAG: hypothetical protein WBM40_21370 [Thiohalocapsa sp.]